VYDHEKRRQLLREMQVGGDGVEGREGGGGEREREREREREMKVQGKFHLPAPRGRVEGKKERKEERREGTARKTKRTGR
jgi:hypothetical protein